MDVLAQVDEIRVQILEQMYEYHWREATTANRLLLFAGQHYTYRDMYQAHLMAAEWVAREHMGILKYVESAKRLRPIQNRINKENKALLEKERIAE